MKFVVGRISTMSKLWATPENLELVRKTQENVAKIDANASWIDTDDLKWGYYGHYGTKGQIDLGIRFANEFKPKPAANANPSASRHKHRLRRIAHTK